MTEVDLLTFSMRSTPPGDGADWCRIVNAKGSEPAKVYIYDEIGFWGTSAKDFAAELAAIDSDEIEVHLNSPGGSVFDGLAIHASLKSHKATVTAIVDGLAASAASFILQAADVRKTTRNAQIMIHDAKAYAGGNAEQMRKAAELLDKVSDNIADIYQVRSGEGTVESWRALMRAGDEWYTGNEALDAGLVDEVVDNPKEDEDAPEDASNSWSTKDIEAFLKASPEKLAADGRLKINNRVEEAQMSGNTPEKKNEAPPAVPTPPAPMNKQEPVAPVAAAPSLFMVNGAEVSDFAAVQAHINSLETFRAETLATARREFVANLASDGKILANEESITQTEAFAMSLSSEQFNSWKATMSSAPSNPLFGKHGVGPGDKHAPANTADQDIKARIASLEEIVQSHRDAGMSEERLAEKASYKELQNLKSQQAGA